MPTYDYRCDRCGHGFERFQKMSDAQIETCPDCGGKIRLIGTGAAVILKGSSLHAVTPLLQPHRITVRVRYPEADPMGRLHHSVYLVYFEMGRTEYMRVRGMVYAEMERRGRFIPIVSVQVKYRAAARYDDVLTIETWVRKIHGARVFFTSRVVREESGSETLLAEADVCGALVNSAGHPHRFSNDEITVMLGPPKATAHSGIPEADGLSTVEAVWKIAGNELSNQRVIEDRSPTQPG